MHELATSERPSRPAIVTAVCVVGAIAMLVGVLRIAARWEAFQSLRPALQAGTAAALAVTAATLASYWRMRRWGLWLLTAAVLFRAALGAARVVPTRPTDLAMPVLLMLTGLAYVKRLR